MPSARSNAALAISCTIALLFAGSVAAQQRPAPPVRPAPPPPERSAQEPPQSQAEAPQRTTATYEDWVVQCEIQAGPPEQRVCDMAQVTQVQGKNLPFSRVVVTHPVRGQPIKLVVQVPVNASFATDVRIQTADSDPGLAAPFARCLPAGCFAEFDVKEEMLKKLRAASGSGKLSFADAGGHDVSVPLSFKGFNQAYEALAKE